MKRYRILAAVLAVFCTLAASVSAKYFITRTFDYDMEGWSPVNDVTLSWKFEGGAPGPYLEGIDRATGDWWHYGAPGKFEGNRSPAFGEQILFYLKASPVDSGVGTDVIIEGPFTTLVTSLSQVPTADWFLYKVPLDTTQSWRVGTITGALATAQDIQAVLGDIYDIRIRGEYHSGVDTGGLDFFILQMSDAPPAPTMPVVSTFDASDEGWYQITNVTRFHVTHVAAGGNPGGYIKASDTAAQGVWYFVAPPAFTGNVSAAYGKDLTFDMAQIYVGSQFDGVDIQLVGERQTLVYDTPYNPQIAWTWFRVPIVAGGWHVGGLDGPLATEAEMRTVLSDLHALRIRGEYRSGTDTAWLDNVQFGVTPLRGDANRDGLVNALDAAIMLRIAGGLQAAPAEMVTVDLEPTGGDGVVDIRDAARALKSED